MAELKVGNTVWRYDDTVRHYDKDRNIILADKWVQYVVTDVTRLNYIVKKTPDSFIEYKLPKKPGQDDTDETRRVKVSNAGITHSRFYFTDKAKDDALYVMQNQNRISHAVGNVKDADLLRKVAELIGYKP